LIATEFINVSMQYRRTTVLKNISFEIEAGTFAVIFGPPGCGKSVLMRLLTGLEKPSFGKILLREKDVTLITAGERELGYVPQAFALYPHYRVYDNIAYPLKLVGAGKSDIDSAVKRSAEMLRITPLLEKYPDQLSGGEKQRVALARGITKKTEIYVFDDPLSGLDFKLREQLIDDLREMQRSLGATFIYTTSDPLEALMLAQQVFILYNGEIVESGLLENVYYRPMHIRSMELLGFPNGNILEGKLYKRNGRWWCRTSIFDFPVSIRNKEILEIDQDVYVTMKPQAIKFGPKKGMESITFNTEVVLKEDLGGEFVVHLDTNNERLLSVVRQDEAHLVSNEKEDVVVLLSDLVVYSRQSGERIGEGG